jgi:hypothetical protein
MTCRAKFHIISLLIVPILILPDTGARSAEAPARLDAYYSATLLGLPIGHISWVVDLQGNRFNSVATGSISGFLRLFLDAQGSVAAEGHLSDGKPVASRFQLKILAGEASIAAGPRLILFAAQQTHRCHSCHHRSPHRRTPHGLAGVWTAIEKRPQHSAKMTQTE